MTLKELIQQRNANLSRMREINDAAKAETRELTQEEKGEMLALERDINGIDISIREMQSPTVATDNRSFTTQLREAMDKGQGQVTIRAMREINPATTAALANTGIIPISEQELLKPLREESVLGQLGITVPTGLVGELRWPYHSKVEAEWADEAVALSDKKIDYGSLKFTGHRLGIAIPVTKEQIYHSEHLVEDVCKSEMGEAIAEACDLAVVGVTPAVAGKVVGPFAEADCYTKSLSAIPTFEEFSAMKVQLLTQLKKKVKKPGWIMTEAQKAIAERTPKAPIVDGVQTAQTGSLAGAICEDGKILGWPVVTTDKIEDGIIELGDFSYCAFGQFGELDFIADPYTLARRHSVDFVLNSNFGLKRLRKEAFIKGVVATTPISGGDQQEDEEKDPENP